MVDWSSTKDCRKGKDAGTEELTVLPFVAADEDSPTSNQDIRGLQINRRLNLKVSSSSPPHRPTSPATFLLRGCASIDDLTHASTIRFFKSKHLQPFIPSIPSIPNSGDHSMGTSVPDLKNLNPNLSGIDWYFLICGNIRLRIGSLYSESVPIELNNRLSMSPGAKNTWNYIRNLERIGRGYTGTRDIPRNSVKNVQVMTLLKMTMKTFHLTEESNPMLKRPRWCMFCLTHGYMLGWFKCDLNLGRSLVSQLGVVSLILVSKLIKFSCTEMLE
ncbi:hypothetical protein LXL04_010782 [Taraxacum kok-saghyz]